MACCLWNSLGGRVWGHSPREEDEPPRLTMERAVPAGLLGRERREGRAGKKAARFPYRVTLKPKVSKNRPRQRAGGVGSGGRRSSTCTKFGVLEETR